MAKSWDIQPNKKRPASPTPQAPAPSRAPQLQPGRPSAPLQQPTRSGRIEPMVRRAALQKPLKPTRPQPKPRPEPEPVKPMTVRREHVPQGRSREPLKNRRKRARQRTRLIISIICVVLIVAAVIVLWLPTFRVQHVQAAGPDSVGVQSTALQALVGRYYFIFPRDSIFFFSSKAIRAKVLVSYPDVSAVSISRTSFNSISIAAIPREAAFVWCGETYGKQTAVAVEPPTLDASSTSASSTDFAAPVTSGPDQTCFNSDGQGNIFSLATDISSATFRIYGALKNPGAQPIGSEMANASAIPSALNFVKSLKTMNIPITSLVIRGDEADLYTPADTRITYVLGKEIEAQQLAQAALQDLNLVDGSVQYVDLRFTGKVYFKKVGSNTESDTSQ